MFHRLVVAAAVVLTAGVLVRWIGGAEEGPAKVIDAGRYGSLQEALDAAPAGGLVKIPPGRYEITEPLEITRGDLRIEGSGTATVIVNNNRDGRPAILVRAPGYAEAPSAAAKRKLRLWRVQLADFRITGNPKSGHGILAEGVNELLIHNLAIDHNGGDGIRMVDCYEDPRISDSIITYNGGAGLNILAGHDIVVNANQFEENRDAVRAIDSFNLCMNGNNIDDHLRHGVVIENTYGSVLSGNMIEECAGTGIVIGRDSYGITVSANVLAHNNGGGVDLRDAWGSTVSANTFTINPSWSLRIGPESGRIAVTGNTFSNSYVGAGRTIREEDFRAEWPKKGYAAGVLVEGAQDVVLAGNVFSGTSEEAIRVVQEAKRLVISGNIMTDTGRKSGGRAPAVSLGGAKGVIQGLNATPR